MRLLNSALAPTHDVNSLSENQEMFIISISGIAFITSSKFSPTNRAVGISQTLTETRNVHCA